MGDVVTGNGAAHTRSMAPRPKLGTPYIVAFVLGAVPVFVNPGFWPVPIIVLLGYLFLGLRQAENDGQKFEFADSVYYLGFTLSMASLLASIQPFKSTPNGPDPSQVLKYFGLGMFTTLIGVAARTSLQLFFQLPQETIEATNRRIHEEADAFLQQLLLLRNEVQSTLEGGVVAVQAHLKDIDGALSEAGSAGTEGVRRFTSATREVVAATDRVTAALTSVGSAFDAQAGATSSIQRNVDTFGRALDEIQLRIVGNPEDGRSLSGGVVALSDSLFQLKQAFTDGVAPVNGALDALSGQSVRAAREIDASAASIQRFVHELDKIGVAPFREAGARLTTALDDLATTMAGDTKSIQVDGLQPLKGALREAAAEAQRFNSLLDDIARALAMRLDATK